MGTENIDQIAQNFHAMVRFLRDSHPPEYHTLMNNFNFRCWNYFFQIMENERTELPAAIRRHSEEIREYAHMNAQQRAQKYQDYEKDGICQCLIEQLTDDGHHPLYVPISADIHNLGTRKHFKDGKWRVVE